MGSLLAAHAVFVAFIEVVFSGIQQVSSTATSSGGMGTVRIARSSNARPR